MGELRIRWTLIGAALISAATSLAVSPRDGHAPFLSENDAAMKKMMAAMHITPSGDVDADFVAMMIPHHQGAIDMAIAELRHGRHERVKRLAQEIIVTQTQEIQALRLALGQSREAWGPSPDSPAAGSTK